MNPNLTQAHELVSQARQALRRNDKVTARMLGEQAALLSPDLEDAWLVLTASDSNPQDALAYAQKALEINPESSRARKGVEWALGQLNQAKGVKERIVPVRDQVPAGLPIVRESKKPVAPSDTKPKGRLILYGATFGLLICVLIGVAAWSAVSTPAFASVLNSVPTPTQENLWAQVNIPKASSPALVEASPFVQAPATATSTIIPNTSTPEPTFTPTTIPTEAPTSTPAATETPGMLAMDVIADTPTSEYIPPTSAPAPVVTPVANNNGGTRGGVRWIDVDLTNQMVYAYEGDTVVNSFVVSTGTAYTPTVTGKYKIWIKLKKTNMSGPGYYLADVPYVMYFYKGYGLHGTYWHSNFGTPMSHGCVNLSIPDAEWLYYWASEGTVVNVHY